jgi:molybdate transport system substrate-binding protein
VRNRLLAALLAALLVLGLAACGDGGDDDSSAGAEADGALVVSAASSLTDAFEAYGDAFGDVRLSFAGSDDLAAQIRQGVKPDVFAAANTRLPDELHAEGLVDRPVAFATNELVLAVPMRADAVTAIADLEKPGTTIAIGTAEVPIGSYTREVLGRLGPARARAILANVRSEEPDVKGIVGKLTQGAVDAGFVYQTDVAATGGALRGIALPAALQPRVAYGVAVVEGAEHPAAARRFVAGLLRGAGASELRAAGFGAPPARG